MKIDNSEITFSPTDLTNFVKSPFASWLDRLNVEYPDKAPKKDAEDEYLKLLAKEGIKHENEFLLSLQKKYNNVVIIPEENEGKRLSDAVRFKNTVDAMKSGADIIFQGCLLSKPFRGYADFLVKVEGASVLGEYHYEVWDTKLANTIKPSFVLQLCCYAEMLESIQGVRPKSIVVALGNGKNEKLLTTDYYDYYLTVKDAFLTQQQNFDPNQEPLPEESKEFGRWSEHAQRLLIQKDHLSLVAGITRSQIKKLNNADIYTCEQLAKITDFYSIKGLNEHIVESLKLQADIQKRSNGQIPPLYEIRPHNDIDKVGLALLPPQSKLDVFFDIEGNPLHEGGLEYLWGNTYLDESDQKQFKDFWAHDSKQEKKAFVDFINWVYARWQEDPTMHIYHYAPYEITACRHMMSKYGVCEYEVDQLLRNEVFVDLYKVVKGAVLLGEPKYSIKNVELLYRPNGRDSVVKNGAASIVVYEEWRKQFDKGECGDTWETSEILNNIRLYNIDDCDSTLELAELLWKEQKKHQITYLGKSKIEEPELSEEVTDRTKLRDELLLQAKGEEGNKALLTENLAYMLEFHRRESKPVFWKLFDRKGQNPIELVDDIDCLTLCTRTIKEAYKPKPNARNLAYEFQFDTEQEFKGNAKSYYVVGETNSRGNDLKVALLKEQSDFSIGRVVVTSSQKLPESIVLIPDEYVNPNPIPQALESVIRQYKNDELENTAIYDYLLRKSPIIKGRDDSSLPIIDSNSTDSLLTQTINTVVGLDNSYLSIQGPPGAGKTYTGKHIIAELMKLGKKVGIASNSHNAINNLLKDTADYCQGNDIEATFYCTKKTDDEITELGIGVLKNDDIEESLVESVVVGTTAWGFSRDDLANQFDYLFVDEAGQVSVANLTAMSRSAKNLVLLGDQMQLGQPSQGKHPRESGLSVLDYLLKDSPIVPDNMGVFLDTTYRMHSKVNEYISEAIYQGKLHSAADTDKQLISVPAGYNGVLDIDAGIRFVPVQHDGNTQASDEEVEEIQSLVKELLGRTFTNKDADERAITLSDILFVAPYNHQVSKLKLTLGESAKVGSVDKFQGQEAPIVIFSLCSSDAAESSRGIDFLFDKHRINVAISRAQSMAIVVGNPNLFNTPVNSVAQMAKVNVLSKLRKYSSENVMQPKIGNVMNPINKHVIDDSIKTVMQRCEVQEYRDIGYSIIHSTWQANPGLSLWKTKTNGGDIRMGVKYDGQQATRCDFCIRPTKDEIKIYFTHPYLLKVLGNNYDENLINRFLTKEGLEGFQIVNGPTDSTFEIRTVINSFSIKNIEKLVAKLRSFSSVER